MTDKQAVEAQAEAIASKILKALGWPFRFAARVLTFIYLILLAFTYMLVAMFLGLPLRYLGFVCGCLHMHFRVGFMRAELTALSGAAGLRAKIDNAGQYELADDKKKAGDA